jgi:circadian locomoter output cycle kaput protein
MTKNDNFFDILQRSRSRHNVQMPKLSNQQHQQLQQQSHSHHQQYSQQFNIPHPQVHSTTPQQLVPPMISQPQAVTIHPPPIAAPIMQHHHHHHQRATATTQIIGTPFIEQSQYITAIPVQSVLAAPTSFPASATVISPLLPPPPEYVHSNVVLTPAQNQIQDHLQRKHEELQKMIVQQQDELRRVSEQLFMARYGLLPPIVNVSLPFVAPMDHSSDTGENSRCMSAASSHISSQHQQQQQQQYEQHQAMIQQQHQSQQVHVQQHTMNPQVQAPQVMHHSMMQQPAPPQQQQQQAHMTAIAYEMNTQKTNLSTAHIDQSMESDQTGNDIMQFMQHQSQGINNQNNQTGNIHQLSQQQQQQMMTSDDFELIPFQMMNSQILYSSGTASSANNNSANNK